MKEGSYALATIHRQENVDDRHILVDRTPFGSHVEQR